MTTFSIVTAAASLATFAGFVALSVKRFGWQKSYSSFAPFWTEAVPINRETHLWSIITVVVALLLVPSLIERGAGNPSQLLGFFAPIYLAIVAFTPEYQTNDKQKVIHIAGAIICAVVSVLWMAFVCKLLWLVPLAILVAGIAGILTKTIERALIFWGEMALFAATYTAVFIGG